MTLGVGEDTEVDDGRPRMDLDQLIVHLRLPQTTVGDIRQTDVFQLQRTQSHDDAIVPYGVVDVREDLIGQLVAVEVQRDLVWPDRHLHGTDHQMIQLLPEILADDESVLRHAPVRDIADFGIQPQTVLTPTMIRWPAIPGLRLNVLADLGQRIDGFIGIAEALVQILIVIDVEDPNGVGLGATIDDGGLVVPADGIPAR